MNDQSLTPTQIRTVFYVIRKHKWKILTLFLSTVVTVAVGSLLATPIYRASSQLLVKPGREDVYVSPTRDSTSVVDRSYQGERVNSEMAILESLPLLVELVDRFGVSRLFEYPDRTLRGRLFRKKPEREMPPIEEVYESVQDGLEVSTPARSNVITVAFEWPDPVIATEVVNTLVDIYLAKHIEVHTSPQTYSLLEEQARTWERKLRESERQLEAFKRSRSITSLPQQRTMLLERLSEIESQREQTEAEVQETLEMIGTLEAQLSSLDENVQLQETVNRSSDTLAALKAKLVDLELQGLKEEIRRVKDMIAKEEKKTEVVVVSGKSPIHEGIEGDLFRAKARLEALKGKEKQQKLQTGTYKDKLRNLDGSEKQIKELERQVEIDETNYKLYLARFQEAKISENMDKHQIANVRLIAPAIQPLKPIRPRKVLNVLIGGFLGVFAGVAMAFLIEFIHPVFRTRGDVDQFLGLPVLVALPKEK